MKRLLLILIVLFTTQICLGAKYFKDLERISTVNGVGIFVRQFDANVKTGGGYFLYFKESNVGITNITGYRIKVASSTTGYFVRMTNGEDFSVDWCGGGSGLNGTLSSLGISQGTADGIWGSGVVNVSNETYDDAAIQYSLTLMESKGFHKIRFSPTVYYIRDGKDLPRVYNYTNDSDNCRFEMEGNCAKIDFIGSGNKSMFRAYPINQTDAETSNQVNPSLLPLVARAFYIHGFIFNGNGNDTALFLGAHYNSEVYHCQFRGNALAIRTEWSHNFTVRQNEFNSYSYAGIYRGIGSWSGANFGNSASHKNYGLENRFYAGSGAYADIITIASSGCVDRDIIHEGHVTDYFNVFDDASSTVVRTYAAENVHIERSVNIAGFKTTLTSGSISLRDFHIDDAFVASGTKTLTDNTTSGYSCIKIENANRLHANTLFGCRSVGIDYVFDYLKDFQSPTTVKNSARWRNGGGFVIPNFSNRVIENQVNVP